MVYMSRQFSNPAEQSHTSTRTTRNLAASERPSAAANRANPRAVDYGQDPVEDYQKKNQNNQQDQSLLYGLANYRKLTQERLNKQGLGDNNNKDSPPRTIDEYNQKIGLTDLMNPNQAHVGIFTLRKALDEPQNWRKKEYFPSANEAVEDEQSNLRRWIDKLAKNKRSIGLYDLGDLSKKTKFLGLRKTTKGLEKIEKKNRFKKNLEKENQGKIKAKKINSWLGESNNDEKAMKSINEKKIKPKQTKALGEFIHKQFFRRTSKLGIDFVTDDLDAKVHFNTAGKANSNSTITNKGLLDIVNSDRYSEEQRNNRSITVSELRHIKKRERQDNNFQNKINYYAEYKQLSE